jgi:2-polyprenyl-3-methyl-5-hydroxy-6-metoxy-1,4-benzoquinol methylase
VTEYKLFVGDVPYVSTAEFHKDRARAPHLEQPAHRPRLDQAINLVRTAAAAVRKHEGNELRVVKAVDLGCGDGGLISVVTKDPLIAAVGYDFQPSNVDGWTVRYVDAQTHFLDFVSKWSYVIDADVYVITECLEHLADPHKMVANIRARGAHLIASSPWTETDISHDECHAWAWDIDGYADMIRSAGFDIMSHEKIGMFQVVWAMPV